MIQLTKEYVQARFEELLSSPLESFEQYIAWIAELDDFESSLSRDFAHKYIAQSCNTADTKAQDEYRFFVQTIHPLWIQYGEQCGRRLIEHPDCDRLPAEYQIHIQGIRKMVELYREENIPLFVQESELTTRYNQCIASQTISYQEEELTMQQARDCLNNPDRTVRKEIFELMEQRRLQDASMIDDILSELITVRTTIARNCGFASYTDYQYSYRFDYTKEQINQFHQTIREVITPIGVHYMAQKQQKL